MNKIIGIGLLVIGLVFLYFGYNEYNSMESEVLEMFTGSPSDNAVWYLAGGGGAAVIGILLLLRGFKEDN